MKNYKLVTIVLWIICLILNILSFFNFISFNGKETSIVWFFISILACVFVYEKIYSPVFSRILISIMAFLGGFFTYFLYYEFYDINAIYMGLISFIIALSLTLGIGVLL